MPEISASRIKDSIASDSDSESFSSSKSTVISASDGTLFWVNRATYDAPPKSMLSSICPTKGTAMKITGGILSSVMMTDILLKSIGLGISITSLTLPIVPIVCLIVGAGIIAFTSRGDSDYISIESRFKFFITSAFWPIGIPFLLVSSLISSCSE